MRRPGSNWLTPVARGEFAVRRTQVRALLLAMLRSPSRPTDAELAILRVLWRRGPSTVRQVREALEQDRPTGYTTALKLLQIMFEKGLALRDESARTHVYRARASEQQTQRQLVRDLIDRAFDGSVAELVRQAVAVKALGRGEVAELRKLLRPGDDQVPAGRAPGADSEPPAAPGGDGEPGTGRLF
jgi:BlaI family transcriptional regulator, penicillinase repressor